jgi:hypothetical protein
MKKAWITTVVAVLLMVPSVANAAVERPKLTFFKALGASIGWSSVGGSSPMDATNSQSIMIVTPTDSAAGAFTWGNAEAANTIVGRSLGAVDNLSFDTKGYLGAGAPRISLTTFSLNDGNHTYFLSAFHCNDPLSSGWVEADFIHDTTSCFIFRDGEVAGYPGWGAVAAVADANGETITDWFLIVDEPTAAQTAVQPDISPATTFVDRLVAQDWGWVRSGGPGIISCLDVTPPC